MRKRRDLRKLTKKLKSKKDEIRKEGWNEVNNFPIEERVKFLISLVKKRTKKLRIASCIELAKIGSPSVSSLIKLLDPNESKFWWMRADAAYTLSIIGIRGAQKSVSALITRLKNDKNEIVRYTSATALGNLGLKEPIEELEEYMEKDPSNIVRRRSGLALVKLNSKSSKDKIIEALNNPKNKKSEFYFMYALMSLTGPSGLAEEKMKDMAKRGKLNDKDMLILQELYTKSFNIYASETNYGANSLINALSNNPSEGSSDISFSQRNTVLKIIALITSIIVGIITSIWGILEIINRL